MTIAGISAAAARALLVGGGLVVAWELAVRATGLPHFILPSPVAVARVFVARAAFLAEHAVVTLTEIMIGWILGAAIGLGAGAALAASRRLERWLKPVVVASQALPVFALAPLLVLWFGYGLGSKVAMAALVIFFPVAIAAFDGLSRTPAAWINSGRALGFTPATIFWRIRLPAALPAIGSGLKIAAAVAPIGAVIGEWVGASRGLGFVMLQANARMQIDVMFAALVVLATMAIALHALTARLVDRAIPWNSTGTP